MQLLAQNNAGNTTEKKVIELREVSLSPEQFSQLLKQQKLEYKQYSVDKRKSIVGQRIKDIKNDRLLKSDGSVHHQNEFKKANKALEFFQPEFPLLKFPQDFVLNTYDNTKRWLKDFDFPNKKQYWEEFKKNNFKHYKKQHPFSYAPGIPTQFEEFKTYHYIEHEESQIEKYRRLQNKNNKIIKPTRITSDEFSRPIFDRTHIHVNLNPIHQVQYIPNQVTSDSTDPRSFSRQSLQSKLNDMQKVKPFTSCSTRSQIFQKKYKPLNAEQIMPIDQPENTQQNDQDFDI